MAAVTRPGRAVREVADRIGVSPGRLAAHALLLVAGLVGLYVLAPELVDFVAVTPAILELDWWWLGLMVVSQAASLVALALLVRTLLPRAVSWVDVLVVQLGANAASLSVPGGAAVGAAVSGRLFTRAGVKAGDAAGALTASSLLSTLTIAALAPVAGALALLQADLPGPLEFAVLAGSVLAGVLLVVAVVLVTADWPLRAAAALARTLDSAVLRHVGHRLDVTTTGLHRSRAGLQERLGDRWPAALGYAGANWLLDFATLALALAAVGADISLGVALLAFVAAAVLRMIPVTPGGLGFVEGGLASLLTVAGLPALGALVVVLAYRAASFWLPLPAGAVAYAVFRRRHPAPA
ncbi:MAG TPA: lysylphosphatidylglycerol synthase transmembrane domain-containing protein [Acidimicrobiia bacterium]